MGESGCKVLKGSKWGIKKEVYSNRDKKEDGNNVMGNKKTQQRVESFGDRVNRIRIKKKGTKGTKNNKRKRE